MNKPLLLLFVASSLLACSAWSTAAPVRPVVTPGGAPPPDAARICVARTSHLAQAVAFPTWDNRVLVGATKGPTHFCWLAAPGAHELTMKADNDANASIVVEAGRDYVLEQKLEFVFGIVNVRPAWVSSERAAQLFADSDYEVLESVPADQRLPEPTTVVPAK